MSLHQNFCKKLRLLRVEKGWSQENMADTLGLSYNGYAKIERGETDISLSRIEQIANVFRVSALSLIFEQYTDFQDDKTLHILHLYEKFILLERRIENVENKQNGSKIP